MRELRWVHYFAFALDAVLGVALIAIALSAAQLDLSMQTQYALLGAGTIFTLSRVIDLGVKVRFSRYNKNFFIQ